MSTAATRGRALEGHLRLNVGLDSLVQPYIRSQSFRAPLHLSKPHRDADALVVNLVNPTAGLFDGDRIDIQIEVEDGARLVLTTPSAGRVFRSRGGGFAGVCQEFHVSASSFFEFYPEPFIPQAGARYHQHTRLEVEQGGTLLFFDWLTPGRVASGEVFEYAELKWDVDFVFASRLVARERYTLNPADDSLAALRRFGPAAHYIGCFVAGDITMPSSDLESLNDDGIYIGHGLLADGAHAIKAVCADSLAARRTLSALRQIMYRSLDRKPPRLGRPS